MNITILEKKTAGDDISVVVNGKCDHAGATVEICTYAKPTAWSNEDSEDLPTLICPNCDFEEIQDLEEEI